MSGEESASDVRRSPSRIERADPSDLSPDPKDVRSTHEEPGDALRRSVEKNGIMIPIQARRVDGDLLVFDGVRRVRAAASADTDIPVLVTEDLDDADALARSLTLNDDAVGIAKGVSDSDRERSVAKAADAADEEVKDLAHRLGLWSEEDRLDAEIGDTSGVGPATLRALVEEFGDADSVPVDDAESLQRVDGVGPETAEAIVGLDIPDGGSVVEVHDVEW